MRIQDGTYERAALVVALAAMLVAVLVTSGCTTASPGRVTLGEWNSLSAEQMTAITPSDEAVYGGVDNRGTVAEDVAKAGPTWWVDLAEIISGLRVRIQLVRVEWGATAKTQGGPE
jgi:hypothetical protein